jgi:hypothetical protein
MLNMATKKCSLSLVAATATYETSKVRQTRMNSAPNACLGFEVLESSSNSMKVASITATVTIHGLMWRSDFSLSTSASRAALRPLLPFKVEPTLSTGSDGDHPTVLSASANPN